MPYLIDYFKQNIIPKKCRRCTLPLDMVRKMQTKRVLQALLYYFDCLHINLKYIPKMYRFKGKLTTKIT